MPPDEEQVAPTVNRMAWEVTKTFDWAHVFHRSLYDLFSSDKVKDKDAAYRKLLADYLEKPEAITPHRLDHHRALWEFEESKAFRDKFPKFNTQIWAYHWLQAAVYDVQLLGDVRRQQELMPEGHRLLPRLPAPAAGGVAVHADDAGGGAELRQAVPRGSGDLRQPPHAARQLR